jgi:hypothetical protein
VLHLGRLQPFSGAFFPDRDKHSSLLRTIVNYNHKKFNNIRPRIDIYKTIYQPLSTAPRLMVENHLADRHLIDTHLADSLFWSVNVWPTKCSTMIASVGRQSVGRHVSFYTVSMKRLSAKWFSIKRLVTNYRRGRLSIIDLRVSTPLD